MATVTEDVLIFANPIAGRGLGQAVAQRIASRLGAEGWHPRLLFAPPPDLDPASLACDTAALAAIVVGGDGTLRAVAQRLLEQSSNAGCAIPPLLVVPLGTANLMGQHLGIHWSDQTLESQIARTLAGQQVIQLDAALANDRLFLLMAGIGLDAIVVHELDRLRSGPITLASYATPLLLALQQYDYPPLRVEVDGRCVYETAPAIAFIGNVPEYGTGFPILTEARSDDGVLDICVLPCRSRGQVAQWAMLVAAGEHLQAEGVVYVKGKSARIASPRGVPVQVDGEPAGHTPLAVRLLPQKLPFIVPPRPAAGGPQPINP